MGGTMTQFDDARLQELLEIFGQEDFAMVVEAFLDETGHAVAALSEMVGSRPDPVREAQMHYLVGAARNLGAVAFGDICKRHQLSKDIFSADDYAHLCQIFQETSAAFTAKIAESMNNAA